MYHNNIDENKLQNVCDVVVFNNTINMYIYNYIYIIIYIIIYIHIYIIYIIIYIHIYIIYIIILYIYTHMILYVCKSYYIQWGTVILHLTLAVFPSMESSRRGATERSNCASSQVA